MIVENRDYKLIVKCRENRFHDHICYKKLCRISADIAEQFDLYGCTIEFRVISSMKWYEEGYMTHVNKNNYLIHLNVNCFSDSRLIYEVIAHELAHVYQCHHRIMIMYSNGNVKWKGILYKPKSGKKFEENEAMYSIDKSVIFEYDDHPWEVDANLKAKKILNSLKI